MRRVAYLVLWASVTTGLGCYASQYRETNIDLTAYQGELERLCNATYSGVVSDVSEESASEESTMTSCSFAGETYSLVMAITSGMSCIGSEDEPDVDCTHAQNGVVRVHAELQVGTASTVPLAAGATVLQLSWMKEPEIKVGVEPPPDEGISYQRFDVRPDPIAVGGSIESFDWVRCHTETGVIPSVWEHCNFSVE